MFLGINATIIANSFQNGGDTCLTYTWTLPSSWHLIACTTLSASPQLGLERLLQSVKIRDVSIHGWLVCSPSQRFLLAQVLNSGEHTQSQLVRSLAPALWFSLYRCEHGEWNCNSCCNRLYQRTKILCNIHPSS